MTRYVTKGSDAWEVCCEKCLADSNHKSLVRKTEHPQVSKVEIEPESCDQAQEARNPFSASRKD